jgi:E3 ubiquitin-protein ligase UHRF1
MDKVCVLPIILLANPYLNCTKCPNLNCSDEHGDRPRPLPVIPELKKAQDIMERKERPSWDFDVSG